MTSDSLSDTIPVRPDERFDEARLAAYLRDRLPGADGPLQVRQFGGGAANLTYLLDYGGADARQYVLRRPPLGPLAKSAHDMGREFRVLSTLYQAYPYAPRAYLYCGDAGIIGAEFFVMERRQGLVVRRTLPAEFAAVPDAPRQMSLALVDALAEFHAVDYNAIGLGDLGQPDGFIARQVEGWYKRWQAAGSEDVPAMDAVYAWLAANQPLPSGPSLVHNDYKLDNILLDPANPGRVMAVFDWDMCTLGDPLSDLGALLAYWIEPSDPPALQAMAMMPAGDLGFPSRSELVERYTVKSGRSIQNINFYHALGLFRVTVIIAQISIRYLRGQTQDRRFAALGQMIPLTAQAALDVAQMRR